MANTATAPPAPRRIVTGHTEDGLGKIAIDEVVALTPMPGPDDNRQAQLWLTHQFPDDTNNDEDGARREVSPGLIVQNGSNLRVTDMAPGGQSPWHRTESIDYNIVVMGTPTMITDNGDEVQLRPFDTVIQRGTMHKWENRTNEWSRLISVLLPATPRKVGEGDEAKLLKTEWRV